MFILKSREVRRGSEIHRQKQTIITANHTNDLIGIKHKSE